MTAEDRWQLIMHEAERRRRAIVADQRRDLIATRGRTFAAGAFFGAAALGLPAMIIAGELHG